MGWAPDPDWPAVPAGHQWWQPTKRGLRRRRTAIVLVGLSSAAGLICGIYRIAILTIDDHVLSQALQHRGSGWYQSPPLAIQASLTAIWLCSIALLIPASSIGASELLDQGRRGPARAAAFVALLCVGVVAEYCASLEAFRSSGPFLAPDAWLHDGRSWFALMCLVAIGVFAGTVRLLKPAGAWRSASTA